MSFATKKYGFKTPVVRLSHATIQNNRKKQYKYIETLHIFSVDAQFTTNLLHWSKRIKHISQLRTDCTTQAFTHALTPNLKSLQSVFIRNNENDNLGYKSLSKINKKLIALKSYRCTIASNQMRVLRTLKKVEDFTIETADLSFKKMDLMKLKSNVRHIAGLNKIEINTKLASLMDIAALIKEIPNVKRFRFVLLEVSLPKDVQTVEVSLLSKIEALQISSISRSVFEFIMNNVNTLENLGRLQISGNNATILNLSTFNTYTLFSRFQYLEKLRYLQVNFRCSNCSQSQLSDFFASFRAPINLQRLSVSLNNLSLSSEGLEVEGVATMLKQIESLKLLRNLSLRINLDQSDNEAINRLFDLLPTDLPDLKACELFIQSSEPVVIQIQKVLSWLSTHKKIEYIQVNVPRMNYAGFEELELPHEKFLNLRILHLMSTNSNFFSKDYFESFICYISNIKNLRSLHFNCWGLSCSFVEIDSINNHLRKLKLLNDLVISLDSENIEIEELFKFQELLKDKVFLKYFGLFVRKRGFVFTTDQTKRFKNHFLHEKLRLKNSLSIYVNQRQLL